MISLHHFHESEFKHPDLCDSEALVFLDQVRSVYDNPLVVTDDARTPPEVEARENQLQGGSATSLHALGRAFDLRWPVSTSLLFKFVQAVCRVEKDYSGKVELELDFTEGNKHLHIGLTKEPRGSTLLLRKG